MSKQASAGTDSYRLLTCDVAPAAELGELHPAPSLTPALFRMQTPAGIPETFSQAAAGPPEESTPNAAC